MGPSIVVKSSTNSILASLNILNGPRPLPKPRLPKPLLIKNVARSLSGRIPTSSTMAHDAHSRLAGIARMWDIKLPFSLAPDARAHALHGGAEVVGGDGEGRELVGGYALLEVAEADGAAHAHQGGLAAQGLQVGARVASGQGCYLPQVEVGVRGHLAGVDTQYVQPRFGVGQADLDLVVEPARAPERGVQRRRPVGGGNDADSPEVVQPVHEGEKLGDEGGLEALAHHVARGGEGVYLVEEDDRGRLGPRLVENGAQLGLALAPELVEDLRPRDGYEVGPALVGDGPRQEGLARPRRPVEENALVRPDV